MVLNQADAWKYIFSLVESDNLKVDISTVNKIHKIAAKEDALTWGTFRDGNRNHCRYSVYPPPYDRSVTGKV